MSARTSAPSNAALRSLWKDNTQLLSCLPPHLLLASATGNSAKAATSTVAALPAPALNPAVPPPLAAAAGSTISELLEEASLYLTERASPADYGQRLAWLSDMTVALQRTTSASAVNVRAVLDAASDCLRAVFASAVFTGYAQRRNALCVDKLKVNAGFVQAQPIDLRANPALLHLLPLLEAQHIGYACLSSLFNPFWLCSRLFPLLSLRCPQSKHKPDRSHQRSAGSSEVPSVPHSPPQPREGVARRHSVSVRQSVRAHCFAAVVRPSARRVAPPAVCCLLCLCLFHDNGVLNLFLLRFIRLSHDAVVSLAPFFVSLDALIQNFTDTGVWWNHAVAVTAFTHLNRVSHAHTSYPFSNHIMTLTFMCVPMM